MCTRWLCATCAGQRLAVRLGVRLRGGRRLRHVHVVLRVRRGCRRLVRDGRDRAERISQLLRAVQDPVGRVGRVREYIRVVYPPVSQDVPRMKIPFRRNLTFSRVNVNAAHPSPSTTYRYCRRTKPDRFSKNVKIEIFFIVLRYFMFSSDYFRFFEWRESYNTCTEPY